MANTKPNYTAPTDLPVLHSSIPRDNMFSMTDSAGNRRWLSTGREINGYKIHSSDPNGKSVTLEKDGRLHVVGLPSSSPTPYTAPIQPVQNLGADAYLKDPIIGLGIISDEEQKNIDSMNFDDATFSRIVENTKKSPYMTEEDKKNIIKHSDYMKKAEKNELEIGKKYFIPKLFDDGNVDFDVYTHQGQETPPM